MEMPSNDILLERLLGPAGPEILCDECFEKLDQYVELLVKGDAADNHIPGMRAHLAGCPACQEEFESMRALVADGEASRNSLRFMRRGLWAVRGRSGPV